LVKIMAKVKKFANGGALSDIVGTASKITAPPGDNSAAPSSVPLSYGGSGQTDGMTTSNPNMDQTQRDINAASSAMSNGGSFKKGGHITTRRVSSGVKSKKSPTW